MTTTIREVMTAMPVALSPDQAIVDAARLMRDQGIGDMPVVEDDRLVGLVTDRDLGEATVGEACSATWL